MAVFKCALVPLSPPKIKISLPTRAQKALILAAGMVAKFR